VSKSRTLSEIEPGVLFVVSGPSGTGKSTLCRAAMKRFKKLEFSVSYTTRRPRPNEVDGRDYYFVDESTFKSLRDAGRLAEFALVHGHYYGTSLDVVRARIGEGISLLLDIDPQGAAQIKERYPEAAFVFFVPPSPRALEERLRGRGTDPEEVIAERLANSIGEMRQCTWYDYIIINDDFDRALEKFCAVILAEKCRRERSTVLVEQIMAEYGLDDTPGTSG